MSLYDTREIDKVKIVMLKGQDGDGVGSVLTLAGAGVAETYDSTTNIIYADILLHREPKEGDRILVIFTEKITSPTYITVYGESYSDDYTVELSGGGSVIEPPAYLDGVCVFEYNDSGWPVFRLVGMSEGMNGILPISKGGTGNSVGYIQTGKASGVTTIPTGVTIEGYNNTPQTGSYSHLEGSGNKATGNYAHLEGLTNEAGAIAHAEGNATKATGQYSHAEGKSTTANNTAAHAEGQSTTASGAYAHAEGYDTTASGTYSHAEGQNTTASNNTSHAEGISTSASMPSAHAEGNGTAASNYQAHAEGYTTTASGQASHAEGNGTTASALGAHAEGGNTLASGQYSHASGYETIADQNYQAAYGKYNKALDDTLFEVGNGTASNARSNAFEVHSNGHVLDGLGNDLALLGELGLSVDSEGYIIQTLDNE